jgi:hypothetical protein
LNLHVASEILVGGVIAGALSIGIWWLSWRILPRSAFDRYTAAIAFALAFFVGYTLLPSWAPLKPSRHWHWLPWLGTVAMALGNIGLAQGVSAARRWLPLLLLAAMAALVLVPTWSDLAPPRAVYIAIFGGYLFLLAALLDPLPARVPPRLFLAILSAVSAAVAIMAMVFVSVKFGQVAVVAAAATVGCLVASFFHSVQTNINVHGLIPAFVVVVGGLALVSFIEPAPPLYGMLLVPAASLTLWSYGWGPLARLGAVTAAGVQVAAVLVPLAISWIWAMLGEGAERY